MNRFRRIAVSVVLLEVLVILLCNAMYVGKRNDAQNRLYRVEIVRVAKELQNKSPEEIDLKKYATILGIEEFQPGSYCNDDYAVEQVSGKQYRIRYRIERDYKLLCYINVAFVILLIVTGGMLWYIGKKLIRPFYRMSDMTCELAKGNLTKPVKEEKSRFFGRFLWGMDMLRENLEANKEKELNLQKEKKGLLLSLSHDIKTPLSAIELYNRALLQGMYDTEERRIEAYQGIERNIVEIKNYVDEIIKASREEFLDLEVIIGEVYFSKIMEKIVDYYGEKLALLHTDFEIKTYEDCILKGDENRYVEVLQNVLENAIKYGDGRRITISTTDEEDCRLIFVDNTGEKLPEEELSNVFDSFYRGSNSKGVKGSGLGLYICKNLLRKMDGDIYVENLSEEFRVAVVMRKA